MTDRTEALEKLLSVFHRYYNIEREKPAEPFAAEAAFHEHNENYVFTKRVKIGEQDTNEYVFFALAETLTPQNYDIFKERAWEEGLSRAVIGENHRNSDISLYILANRIDPEAGKLIEKSRLSKTYRFGFRGYSHYRVIAYDLSSGKYVHNYMGHLLAKTIRNVFPE